MPCANNKTAARRAAHGDSVRGLGSVAVDVKGGAISVAGYAVIDRVFGALKGAASVRGARVMCSTVMRSDSNMRRPFLVTN